MCPSPYPRPDNQVATAHWCTPARLLAIHASLRTEPLGSSVFIHTHWTDKVRFFPGGWFGAAIAAWLITRESSGYCYSTSYGEQNGPESVAAAGCVHTGAFPAWLGLTLLAVVLVAAALGPAYVRRSGLRQAAG